MRVLLIHNYYKYYGGEDSYFDMLVRLLKGNKHEIYTYTKSNRDIDEKLATKIKTAKGLFLNKQTEHELGSIIKSFRPQIAHISNLFPLISAVAYNVCKRNKIPIVQSIHTFRYLCPKGTLFRNGKFCDLCVTKKFAFPSIFYRCYNDSILASAALSSPFSYHNIRQKLKSLDILIFPSEAARECHIKYLKLNKKKTDVIPNFVYDPKIKNLKKHDYFIFIGRFAEEKNILWLLEIFSLLPQYKLVVVGNGPLVQEVLKHRKYSNILIKVNVSKKKVFELLSGAICTMIPSPVHYEFGPIVMMESFSCGTPVLVPKGGIFLDRVKEGKTGYFYEENNQESFLEKINYIYISRKQIKKLSKFIRKEFKEKYTPEYHYERLYFLYKKIINHT